MSLANYASIVLMLVLAGGILYFLFRRRSRLTKLGAGSPAVLQPRAGVPSPALPSTLNEGPQPSAFRDAVRPSERERTDEHAAPNDRQSTEVRPAPAPDRPAPSPIVELHFVAEPKVDESSRTGSAPLLAALTEADVVEGKKDLPASA